jgi:hypothetical protein
MKQLAFSILLLSVVTALAWAGQQDKAPAKAAGPIDRPAEANLAFDDDGGKVQIVPPDMAVSVEKKFHGGEVMKAAQQVSIFLGTAWADREVRLRQAPLANLLAQQNATLEELKKNNVRALGAAPAAEDFTDLAGAPLNDLMIQRKLSDLLASKAIPAPNASTVYVVYLAPGVASSLGGLKATADYAAYHNFVHLEAGEVRYVVVPFHDNSDLHTAAAARAFAEAALNPNGNGWY